MGNNADTETWRDVVRKIRSDDARDELTAWFAVALVLLFLGAMVYWANYPA